MLRIVCGSRDRLAWLLFKLSTPSNSSECLVDGNNLAFDIVRFDAAAHYMFEF